MEVGIKENGEQRYVICYWRLFCSGQVTFPPTIIRLPTSHSCFLSVLESPTMDWISGIFSAFGLSASAGLNAYIPLLVVALLARFTKLITLGSPLDALTNEWIIILLVVLSIIEFFADKVPLVNHVNDLIQSFVRPAAGAILFAATAQVITDIHPALALAAGLLIAGGVHAAKAGALRPAVTTTTGGLGNVAVSTLEDVIATGLSILSVIVPILAGLLLVPIIIMILWIATRRSRRTMMERTPPN